MIQHHLWGILNVLILKVDNAQVESINSRIEMVKVRIGGFRNKERYTTPSTFTSSDLASIQPG